MKIVGSSFKIVGWIIFFVVGLWGLIVTLKIISAVAGFWGLVAALTIFPATFVAAPLYSGFVWGNWEPLILVYGGSIAGSVLISIGHIIRRD